MHADDRKLVTDESPTAQGTKVAVIGVGGGGMNCLEALLKREWPGVQFIAVNRDKLRIRKWAGSDNILLDAEKNSRDRIEVAVMSQELCIRSILAGKDTLILIAGLGGMTGTYATPIIARIAKTMGIKTWAIAFTPFAFEGEQRKQQSQEGIQLLKQQSVAELIIANQQLIGVCESYTSMYEAFSQIEEVAAKVVGSIVENGEISKNVRDENFKYICW
ncbi:MAG TPA: hypothetical protein VKA23_02100 [Mariprofundaceae bacterium]|nr:hypothetical protein [Mariprofundaceae bacterium]